MTQPVSMQGWAGETRASSLDRARGTGRGLGRPQAWPSGELAVRAVYLARLNGFLGRLPCISDTAFDRYTEQIYAGDVQAVLDDPRAL